MYIILAVIILAALYAIFVYNGLVRARQVAEEAWSGIDVQLKRRADLIPNLIETVKGYAAHERQTLDEVVELRNKAQAVPSGDIAARGQVEGLLSQALGRVIALAEAYPDLKANTNFLELQRSLEGIEGEIQMSRRYYNGAARDLNVKVESFPNNLLAGPFGFSKRAFFEITNEADRAVPSVKF
ncbi:LemA family protein [Rhizobium sp. CB3171]|uniref:LemA family protein n=1 Tax=unclassified Rhizobium TaxID=2613769 RepID=UPI000CDF40C4|nr:MULTISPECIES: LemA family protein [Rhizobium]AVA20527.1 LemA family protein [Rhizobium sp. NXC24]MDK4741970.1 LemA family protein [Rhizobium sp. CNPSo 3464]UWU21808.1 LemA family protein [Rhizobium tropici]WFU02626.1 LemA family protein [Rhizobium sp. CB3171]